MQESTQAQTLSPEGEILQQIKMIARNMTAWLKLLGVLSIIQGAFIAMSIVGIIIAWLPIWLGVLLFQAGNRAQTAEYANNPRELVVMMDKLKMYFIIQGILFIVLIAMAVLGVMIMGGTIFSVLSQFDSGSF